MELIGVNELTRMVEEDIRTFFKEVAEKREPFFGEGEFKSSLAHFLNKSDHGYNVFTEYAVRKKDLEGYSANNCLPTERSLDSWLGNVIYIDLVLEKDGKYIAIELKYKHKTDTFDFTRFGCSSVGKHTFTNHGAHNDNLYAYWKDVKRLELIRSRFSNVVAGMAIFLTNEECYTKDSESRSSYKAFTLVPEHLESVDKHWSRGNNLNMERRLAKQPDITLLRTYPYCSWQKFNSKNATKKFYYFYTMVEG